MLAKEQDKLWREIKKKKSIYKIQRELYKQWGNKKGTKIFVPHNSKYAGNNPNKSITWNDLKESSNYIVIKKLLGKAKPAPNQKPWLQ